MVSQHIGCEHGNFHSRTGHAYGQLGRLAGASDKKKKSKAQANDAELADDLDHRKEEGLQVVVAFVV